MLLLKVQEAHHYTLVHIEHRMVKVVHFDYTYNVFVMPEIQYSHNYLVNY